MLQAADLTIRLHADDDVVIARVELPAGTLVAKENVRAAVRIPAGHKVATRVHRREPSLDVVGPRSKTAGQMFSSA